MTIHPALQLSELTSFSCYIQCPIVFFSPLSSFLVSIPFGCSRTRVLEIERRGAD
jgi:hypothetical protein